MVVKEAEVASPFVICMKSEKDFDKLGSDVIPHHMHKIQMYDWDHPATGPQEEHSP